LTACLISASSKGAFNRFIMAQLSYLSGMVPKKGVNTKQLARFAGCLDYSSRLILILMPDT